MDPDGSIKRRKKKPKLNPPTHSLQTVITALLGNFFVTILKFIGWLVTSSPSMLAESLHSFGDVMNQVLLYAGIQNSKGKTKEHPHGRGSVQYLFNFMSAIGIFTLGCVVTIAHSLHEYFYPEARDNSWWWVSVIILIVSFVTEGYSCYVALQEVWKRKGRKTLIKFIKTTDDPALLAVLLEDSAALLGIMLALCGVIISQVTGSHLADVVCAIGIGIMMGGIAWFLGMTNAKLLIGRSVPAERETEYKEFIQSLKSVDKLIELRTEVLGPGRIYLFLKVDLHPTFFINIEHLYDSAEEIKNGESSIKVLMEASDRAVRSTAREIVKIEKIIKEQFPEIVIIDLELD